MAGSDSRTRSGSVAWKSGFDPGGPAWRSGRSPAAMACLMLLSDRPPTRVLQHVGDLARPSCRLGWLAAHDISVEVNARRVAEVRLARLS